MMSANKNVKMVDLSVYQRGIKYPLLAENGVEGAIVRAGIGFSVDKILAENVNGCLNAGIDVGYYWFSYASSVEEARKEAQTCIKAISKFPAPKYPIFFDGETNSIANKVGRKTMTDIALAFVDEIEKNGYPSGIYANPDWMENRYEKSRLVGVVDIWLAHWTWNPNKPSKYNYKQTMWQWGIEKYGGYDVDANLCFIDYPKKTAEWYEAHNKPTEKPVEKTVNELAREVLSGAWGNGAERKKRLTEAGYDYRAVQDEVNRLLKEEANKKTVDELAIEVIRGVWGNGAERRKRLEAAGYDYATVQRRVDELLKG